MNDTKKVQNFHNKVSKKPVPKKVKPKPPLYIKLVIKFIPINCKCVFMHINMFSLKIEIRINGVITDDDDDGKAGTIV